MFDTSITEKSLKNAAKRLPGVIENMGGKHNLGYSKTLQALSVALLGRPYEEVLALLSSTKNCQRVYPASRFVVLEYGSELILVENQEGKGVYLDGSFPGTDMEKPQGEIYSQADVIAASHNSKAGFYRLPRILHEEYETDDIIGLAELMGVFSQGVMLFTALSNASAILYCGVDERGQQIGRYKQCLYEPLDELDEKMLDEYLEGLDSNSVEERWASVSSETAAWLEGEYMCGDDTVPLYSLSFGAVFGESKCISMATEGSLWEVKTQQGNRLHIKVF